MATSLTASAPLTFPALLWRGLAAGGVAGVAAALVSLLVVEGPLEDALAVEHAAAGGHDHAEELFSRPAQIVGGMIAALVVTTALGLVLAVVFARTRHRLPARTDFGRAVLLAGVGFGAIALLPALKYPANPPGVGDAETVDARTVLWASFVAAMLVVAYLAFVVREKLDARGWSGPHRDSAVAGGAVAAVVALAVAWPDRASVIPAAMPAGVVWEFRVASLIELATLWGVLGVTLGLLLTRAARR